MAGFGRDLRVEKKGPIDLVTEVDLAVERMFRDLVAGRFPGHQVVAEELGGVEPVRSRHCWVFDPLDGTNNFAHGVPIFCSSLALEIDGRAEVAAVYDPTRKELFTAERGGGAHLNGRPMRVSGASRLIDALLVTGFSYRVHETGEMLVSLFAAFLAKAQAVRRLGSAALDLCYVAAGRFDGFWEQHLKPWDTAAGALLVEEAGGRVSSLLGGPFDPRQGEIVAANPAMHDEMVRAIAAWQAGRGPGDLS